MTTIACKDGIIAYDSFLTDGLIVVDDEYCKTINKNGVDFFFCGSPSDVNIFADIYFTENQEFYRDLDVSAFIVGDNILKYAGFDPEEKIIWSVDLDLKKHYALGSGKHLALSAMDLGCSAAEAVEFAAKRDLFTGGKVNTFEITQPDKNKEE